MIKIIVVTNKFKHFTPAKEFFEKLLKANKVQIETITPSKKDFPLNIQEETTKILKIIKKHHYYFKVLLAIKGLQLSSHHFAYQLIKKHSHILFIIWWPRGIEEKLLNKHIDFRLSLSKLTFNHILATIVLLEQIYRSFDILKGWSYHH